MKITEARLKELIFEEVRNKLLENLIDAYVIEELKKLGITEQDDEYEKYKQQAKAQTRRTFLKGAGAATAMGGGMGYIQSLADEEAEEFSKELAARRAEKAAYKLTGDYAEEQLTTMLNNAVNFSWAWGTERGTMQSSEKDAKRGTVSQPGDYPLIVDKLGAIAVLSPEYGVVKKIRDDIRAQLSEGVKDLKPTVTKVQSGTGDAKQWRHDFPELYGLPWPMPVEPSGVPIRQNVVNSALQPSGPFRPDVLTTPQYNGMIYLPYEEIISDMVMPNSHQTPSEHYMYLWDKYVLRKEQK